MLHNDLLVYACISISFGFLIIPIPHARNCRLHISNFRSSLAIRHLISLFLYAYAHTHKQSIVLYCIYRMNECLSVCLTVFRSVCLIELWSNLVHITFLPVIIINTIIYIMYTFEYNTQIPFHSRAAKGVNVWVRKSQWYFFSIFFSVA